MSGGPPHDELWDELRPRQRIARVLLTLSTMDADGSPDEATLKAAAEGVGAFHGPPMLRSGLGDRPRRARTFNEQVRRVSRERHGVEPRIGANVECGLSYSLGAGGTDVPYQAALGTVDPEVSYAVGRQVALDLAGSGYDWCFGPVVDVRTTTNDPVIGVRAFGGDADAVSARAVAYVRGVQSVGVLAAAKHFPGHGDAQVDSHVGVPVVDRDRAALDAVHLKPFAEVIHAGVATIMTAHITLRGLGFDEVATFEPGVATGLLRNDLGFEGLLVSDSLRMGAVSDRFSKPDAVVRALLAGCDVANIKCHPGEVPRLLDALEEMLADGRLPERDLYRAFLRSVGTPPRPEVSSDVQLRTGRFEDERLRDLPLVDDEHNALPLPVSRDGVVGVLAVAGSEAEPLETPLVDLSEMLGVRLRLVTADQALVSSGADVAALVVVCRAQDGPSDAEFELVRAAERSGRPAAVLLAGPLDVAGRCSQRLPQVSAPCMDVFGFVSRSTAVTALRQLVGAR